MISPETAAVIAALSGAIGSVGLFIYRTVKKVGKHLSDFDSCKESLSIIRSEVTTNGGKSLKDSINSLKSTCERMEIQQKIFDQRSKAALHYQERPLFETDRKGRMTWCNEPFQEITKDDGDFSRGHDWIAIVDEDAREDFLIELKSCLQMSRKLDIETTSIKGGALHFVGYPYRISEGKHAGFLIHFNKQEN